MKKFLFAIVFIALFLSHIKFIFAENQTVRIGLESQKDMIIKNKKIYLGIKETVPRTQNVGVIEMLHKSIATRWKVCVMNCKQ